MATAIKMTFIVLIFVAIASAHLWADYNTVADKPPSATLKGGGDASLLIPPRSIVWPWEVRHYGHRTFNGKAGKWEKGDMGLKSTMAVKPTVAAPLSSPTTVKASSTPRLMSGDAGGGAPNSWKKLQKEPKSNLFGASTVQLMRLDDGKLLMMLDGSSASGESTEESAEGGGGGRVQKQSPAAKSMATKDLSYDTMDEFGKKVAGKVVKETGGAGRGRGYTYQGGNGLTRVVNYELTDEVEDSKEEDEEGEGQGEGEEQSASKEQPTATSPPPLERIKSVMRQQAAQAMRQQQSQPSPTPLPLRAAVPTGPVPSTLATGAPGVSLEQKPEWKPTDPRLEEFRVLLDNLTSAVRSQSKLGPSGHSTGSSSSEKNNQPRSFLYI